MNTQQFEETRDYAREQAFKASSSARAFLQQVFLTMAIGLSITGLAAWGVSSNPEWFYFFYSGIMRWIVMLAPLGLVILLSARIHKMSLQTAALTFGIYSLVNGISLAFIFQIYSLGTITQVFFITAGTFLAMALVGLTTKINLQKYSSYFLMALIGLIIAGIVNMFLGSELFGFIYSAIGVLLFCGLTAYDVQKIMIIGANVDPDSDNTRKVAIIGALALYLDFINLFLFLLRIFGGSRD